jgi:VIT1/CCC1 family predicted Fe2+/Mn2+ transporter
LWEAIVSRLHIHPERHLIERVGWLRAAVLGANDGIVSTASLIVGVASSGASPGAILISGLAGLVAGAMSMAAGEYVSVSSQTDTEQADLAREAAELKHQWPAEVDELATIYQSRGLDPAFARKVAEELMKNDPLTVHAREELGISETTRARPIQAAITSALTFAVGAALPMFFAWLVPASVLIVAVSVGSLVLLAILGAVGASVGGASISKGAVRVAFWGMLAMAVTAGVGALFGTVVA